MNFVKIEEGDEMKCTECSNCYELPNKSLSCSDGGDVSNPTEDAYCATVDGFDGDMDAWERSKG